MLPFEGLLATRGQVDRKAVRTGLREQAIANLNVHGQQLVGFVKGDSELDIANEPFGSLVDDEDLAGVLSFSSAGQKQEYAKLGRPREKRGLKTLTNALESENALLRKARGN